MITGEFVRQRLMEAGDRGVVMTEKVVVVSTPLALLGGRVTFPDISGVYAKDSMVFYLQEGQWVDVVVSSNDFPIYYYSEEPGAASLQTGYWHKYEDGEMCRAGCESDMGIFAPFYSKALYENRTTDEGLIFTTAVRLFAWGGPADYFLTLYNWNSQKGCEIIYHIYKQDITTGWGKDWKETKLDPWLSELGRLWFSGQISKEHYDEAAGQWLEQFE
ncbi:unnamed protein product [marine sediment metagenome]|uniref:Uncharacterized protein n=1 Tax=marine sediment metagenome TaxID=412755 RepID=X1LFX9_9ZZZZ